MFQLQQQRNLVIIDEQESSCSSSIGEESSSSSSSICSSLSSDLTEDATSSSSSHHLEEGPLFEVTSLIAQLPFKRGLSVHFEGKSQSFGCLSSVRSVEDLVKPERPVVKGRMKACKSYGGGLDGHRALSPNHGSRAIAKRGSSSRGSLSSSSLGGRKQSFSGSRPPLAPQRSASHTLLFA